MRPFVELNSACQKKANFSNFCVPDERDLSTGSNFNPQNTQCDRGRSCRTCIESFPENINDVQPVILSRPSGYHPHEKPVICLTDLSARMLVFHLF